MVVDRSPPQDRTRPPVSREEGSGNHTPTHRPYLAAAGVGGALLSAGAHHHQTELRGAAERQAQLIQNVDTLRRMEATFHRVRAMMAGASAFQQATAHVPRAMSRAWQELNVPELTVEHTHRAAARMAPAVLSGHIAALNAMTEWVQIELDELSTSSSDSDDFVLIQAPVASGDVREGM